MKGKFELTNINTIWDFPGGSVVKTHVSIAGGEGLIPGWGTKIPCTAATKSK